MEVSVSPRATMCEFPFADDCRSGSGVDGTTDVVAVAGGRSPIITPGRMFEICNSSLRICCESKSILAFCSSIFFASVCKSAAEAERLGVGASVWAETPANKHTPQPPANISERSFISLDFDISEICWQAE